jgi:hypothetical protein
MDEAVQHQADRGQVDVIAASLILQPHPQAATLG